jgi:hypothetical protein
MLFLSCVYSFQDVCVPLAIWFVDCCALIALPRALFFRRRMHLLVQMRYRRPVRRRSSSRPKRHKRRMETLRRRNRLQPAVVYLENIFLVNVAKCGDNKGAPNASLRVAFDRSSGWSVSLCVHIYRSCKLRSITKACLSKSTCIITRLNMCCCVGWRRSYLLRRFLRTSGNVSETCAHTTIKYLQLTGIVL